MALGATIHRFELALSDVDRSVYESLDLRVARHPSETLRFMLLRVLAYSFSYEEGIGFSKGGLSDTEEPPLSVRDPTGLLMHWIDVGSPGADRLHKATKAARSVTIYTASDLVALRKELQQREIHRAHDIEVVRIEQALLDGLEPIVDRHTRLEITRNDGRVYVTTREGRVLEGEASRSLLAE